MTLSGGRPSAGTVPPMVAPGLPLPSPRIPEEFVPFLDAPFDLTLEQGQDLEEVFGRLRDLTQMNFIVDEEVDLGVTIETPLELSGVTVRKALLAVVDKFEGICFVFRDYGMFVTSREIAATLRSATIPPRDELPRVSR